MLHPAFMPPASPTVARSLGAFRIAGLIFNIALGVTVYLGLETEEAVEEGAVVFKVGIEVIGVVQLERKCPHPAFEAKAAF